MSKREFQIAVLITKSNKHHMDNRRSDRSAIYRYSRPLATRSFMVRGYQAVKIAVQDSLEVYEKIYEDTRQITLSF
jgi:hypothetical protein